MILETAQLLCTAHHCSGTSADIPYKKTHENHPCAVWCRENLTNYMWLARLGKALCREYSFRYGKTHKTEAIIDWALANPPPLPTGILTRFVQAMPDEHKHESAVTAYRNYYVKSKLGFTIRGKFQYATWSVREPPSWFLEQTHVDKRCFVKA